MNKVESFCSPVSSESFGRQYKNSTELVGRNPNRKKSRPQDLESVQRPENTYVVERILVSQCLHLGAAFFFLLVERFRP